MFRAHLWLASHISDLATTHSKLTDVVKSNNLFFVRITHLRLFHSVVPDRRIWPWLQNPVSFCRHTGVKYKWTIFKLNAKTKPWVVVAKRFEKLAVELKKKKKSQIAEEISSAWHPLHLTTEEWRQSTPHCKWKIFISQIWTCLIINCQIKKAKPYGNKQNSSTKLQGPKFVWFMHPSRTENTRVKNTTEASDCSHFISYSANKRM